MALGPDGERLIKKWDSVNQSGNPHLTSYQDSGGIWTIGWGHTGDDVVEGQVITIEQAELLFDSDVRNKAEYYIKQFIPITISQKQRDALISFTFNAGSGSLQKSRIRIFINKNDHVQAIQLWKSQNIKDTNGNTLEGLISRRNEESLLYAQGTSQAQIALAQGDQLQEPLQNKVIDDKANIVPYTHVRGLGIMSIDELINSKQFITSTLQKNELLELSYQSKTNHRRLYEALSINQKRAYNQESEQYNVLVDYPIVSGATIYMYAEKISIDITYTSNITTKKVFDKKYWPGKIKMLTNDPGYIPAYLATNEFQRDIRPQLTVILWSRVLYLQQGNVGGFIDISKHVNRISVESSLDVGGNFNIHMNPVVGELIQQGEDLHWQIVGDLGPVTLGNITKRVKAKSSTDEFRRSHNFYEKVIQQNDLVFISFEKLELESDSANSLELFLNDKWFDMIGLVDFPDVSGNAAGSDQNTIIRGRDFSKALIDDNSYFNPYSIGHINSLYGGKIGDRFLQGEFKNLAAYLATTIRDKVQFIFHRIASIGYVPDEVFSAFDDRTQVTEVQTGTISQVSANSEVKDAKGIWQMCKVFIDPSISDLVLADDSVSNPQGSLHDLLKKIAQEPFVEFFTDTYKDTFYLIFRQPPFTRSVVDDIVQGFYGQQQQNEDFEFAGNKTTTSELGNEIEQSNTLMIDTDDEDGNAVVNQMTSVQLPSKFPIVVNISEADVISDNLKFSNEAYAWYQVEQRGNFAGNTVTLGHVPAIYFDEYAQVFGNKRLSVTSNYSNYKFFEHQEGEKDKDLYAEQASQDLTFLIETSIYLPFTRKGTITVNGDRRIKKGNWIYYRPTQEFFYVTNVTNQASISSSLIERTTDIQVERGMVKDFMIGKDIIVDGEEIEMSYFNIVNLDKLRNGIYDTVTKGSADDKFDYKSDISLNSKVFEFFLQRKQFE